MICTSSSTRLDYCNFHILDGPLGISINTHWYRKQSHVSGEKGVNLPAWPSSEHIRQGLSENRSCLEDLPYQIAVHEGCCASCEYGPCEVDLLK